MVSTNVFAAEHVLDTLNYAEIHGQSCRLMWAIRDPTMRHNPVSNLFVRNLDESIDHKDLHDAFATYGKILSCKVAKDEKMNSRGFGFVHFETQEAADAAVDAMNGEVLAERELYVAKFKPKADRLALRESKFTNVYVKEIPDEWTEDEMTAAFGLHGEITSMMLKEDGRGRKFGFVNYATNAEARAAIEALDGVGAEGRLYVTRMQSKAERQSHLQQQFRQRGANKTRCNLYVKNLPEDVDDEALQSLMSAYGTVVSVKVMTTTNGRSKGFGFCCFQNAADAQKAVTALHTKAIDGKPLYVAVAERREARFQRLQNRFRAPIPKTSHFQSYGGYPPMHPPMPAMIAPQNYMWRPYDQQPAAQPVAVVPAASQPTAKQTARPAPVAEAAVNVDAVRGALKSSAPATHKQIIGEAIFPVIQSVEPELAGKITGMILEMTFEELHALMGSKQRLLDKCDEAKSVLQRSRLLPQA